MPQCNQCQCVVDPRYWRSHKCSCDWLMPMKELIDSRKPIMCADESGQPLSVISSMAAPETQDHLELALTAGEALAEQLGHGVVRHEHAGLLLKWGFCKRNRRPVLRSELMDECMEDLYKIVAKSAAFERYRSLTSHEGMMRQFQMWPFSKRSHRVIPELNDDFGHRHGASCFFSRNYTPLKDYGLHPPCPAVAKLHRGRNISCVNGCLRCWADGCLNCPDCLHCDAFDASVGILICWQHWRTPVLQRASIAIADEACFFHGGRVFIFDGHFSKHAVAPPVKPMEEYPWLAWLCIMHS